MPNGEFYRGIHQHATSETEEDQFKEGKCSWCGFPVKHNDIDLSMGSIFRMFKMLGPAQLFGYKYLARSFFSGSNVHLGEFYRCSQCKRILLYCYACTILSKWFAPVPS